MPVAALPAETPPLAVADVVRRLDDVDAVALPSSDPTLGDDGGSEEDRAYQDDSNS